MVNIKILYEKTKYNKTANNIAEYKNAISEYLESPYQYITNIEYIIQSSIGLNSFKEFMSKYDIPVCSYNYLIEKFNDCVEKCEKNKLNSSIYKEYLDELKNLKKKNIKFLTMYEYYSDTDMKKYLETFYGITEDIPNCKNVDGMIKTFNEQAIPDMLIASNKIGNKALSLTLEYIKEQSRFNSPLFYQWMSFICEDYKLSTNESIKYFKENSASTLSKKILNTKNRLFAEALLANNKNILIKYTNSDINAMLDMITYNEYVSLCADDIYGEKSSFIKESIKKQNNSLYEELIAMENCSSLDDVDESTIFSKHIQHKRTGASPKYLHGIYGNSDTYEDDEKPSVVKVEPDDSDDELDDIESYRRPSSSKPKPIKKSSMPVSDDDLDDEIDNTDENLGTELKNSLDNKNKSRRGNVYNTYYYNYTNSYNKNSKLYNGNSNSRIDSHDSTDNSLKVRTDKNPIKESSLADFEPWNLDNILDDKVFVETIFNDENSNTCKLCHLPEKVSDEIKAMNTFLSETIHNEIENGSYGELTKLKLERYFNLITSKGYLFEMGDTAILEKNDNIFGQIVILPNVNEEYNINKAYTTESYLGDGNYKSKFKVTRLNVSDDSDIKFVKQLNAIIESAVKKYYAENNTNDNNINLDIIGSKYDVNYVLGSLSQSYSRKILNYLRESEDDNKEEVEDPEMPKSDNPWTDMMTDIDRNVASYQQSAKKGAQSVINFGKAVAKPFKRVGSWLSGLVNFWKDKDEEELKEDLADPENRYNLYRAARAGIHYWALGYAGLLLNPIFVYLGASRLWTRTAKRERIRNEMLNEINTELKIIDEKIEYAKEHNDLKNQFKLMRYKNEIKKKLFKVAGGPNANYIL